MSRTANHTLTCLLLSLAACSRTADAPIADASSTGTSTTDVSTSSESGTTTEPSACTDEQDCGVGERCIDGVCSCQGCACEQPGPPPPDERPVDEAAEIPVFLDILPPECAEDGDCAPLEICDAGECLETTACVEHEDCRGWGDRFCHEGGLCRWLGCDRADEDSCPAGAMCLYGCTWLDLVPDCSAAPQFEIVTAHVLADPDTASIVVLDRNGDAHDDIVVLDGGELSFVMSAGGTAFEEPTPWLPQQNSQFVAIDRGDIDDDGVLELLVSQHNPAGVTILGVGLAFMVPTDVAPHHAAIMDVDYDGLPDLVTDMPLIGANRVQVQLGEGHESFAPLWTLDIEPPFEFGEPYAAYDEVEHCRRTLTSSEHFDLPFAGGRRFEHDDVSGGVWEFGHFVNDFELYRTIGPDARGHVASRSLGDRGVLLQQPGLSELSARIEIAAEPGAVALGQLRADGSSHALIDHGLEPTGFVEFAGDPPVPVCRGSLGFGGDVSDFQIGDFDGDGRDDVLARRRDGTVEIWFSRA